MPSLPRLDRRPDHFDLVAAEQAAFAGMRIERCDAMRGWRRPPSHQSGRPAPMASVIDAGLMPSIASPQRLVPVNRDIHWPSMHVQSRRSSSCARAGSRTSCVVGELPAAVEHGRRLFSGAKVMASTSLLSRKSIARDSVSAGQPAGLALALPSGNSEGRYCRDRTNCTAPRAQGRRRQAKRCARRRPDAASTYPSPARGRRRRQPGARPWRDCRRREFARFAQVDCRCNRGHQREWSEGCFDRCPSEFTLRLSWR